MQVFSKSVTSFKFHLFPAPSRLVKLFGTAFGNVAITRSGDKKQLILQLLLRSLILFTVTPKLFGLCRKKVLKTEPYCWRVCCLLAKRTSSSFVNNLQTFSQACVSKIDLFRTYALTEKHLCVQLRQFIISLTAKNIIPSLGLSHCLNWKIGFQFWQIRREKIA